MSEQHYESERVVAVTGVGGTVDLGADGTERPGKAPGGPGGPGGPGPRDRPRSLWSDAWRDLRRNPVFIVSGLVICFLVLISLWPSAIASGSPLACDLAKAQEGPRPGHPFGFDGQGCDVYTRTVHGARTSVTVGVLATLGVAVLGSVLGALAGFLGGVWDAVLSRITDVFFAIPVVLGGLVLLSVITSNTVWPVIGFIVLLGWPQISRIARGSVITVQQNDYVQAARALGASRTRLLLRHIAPNAVAPVIVVATIALGTYIALEATLSYLGVGLKPPSVSWGIDISAASPYVRNAPHALLWPSGALAVTVLAFIMLGDAVRDALDPKLR
ncbi:ABC transporter permease [Streptomyces griseomycini]|uniref:Oligopeptide transport system permease protein n=1 Tax=Streptomyces griseomycini TaxID=66895 RepID=A0A7W7LVD2_9ACTN|nr:ABC transporter permease [Streptomyces griseomycini]MBB4897160.1 oligopeptide transport system permease protein [Streptomyces griseomycini]GGP93418.1 peptide ABC transporter permease [Streptomyces griseomycini]GGR34257.1 peptide ABC transporter permease [Streptomyces griseomycini]